MKRQIRMPVFMWLIDFAFVFCQWEANSDFENSTFLLLEEVMNTHIFSIMRSLASVPWQLIIFLGRQNCSDQFALWIKLKATIVLGSVQQFRILFLILPLAHIFFFTWQHLFGELSLPNSQSILFGTGMTNQRQKPWSHGLVRGGHMNHGPVRTFSEISVGDIRRGVLYWHQCSSGVNLRQNKTSNRHLC